jgi:hypothetical protein
LEEVARCWKAGPARRKGELDAQLDNHAFSPSDPITTLLHLASYHHYTGHPDRAYAVLEEARARAGATPEDAEDWLYTVVYYQGLTALRRGETENCVMCRGESSCILPISPAALHTNPGGSRLAVKHFTEYLDQFPDDYQVRWLLNVAHMTLGTWPDGLAPE